MNDLLEMATRLNGYDEVHYEILKAEKSGDTWVLAVVRKEEAKNADNEQA